MSNKQKCGHFQLPIADPGPCLTCEREAEGTSSGPLASFAGGRENWRDGQTTAEYMREMKDDLKHLPKDRHPIPANRGRWV